MITPRCHSDAAIQPGLRALIAVASCYEGATQRAVSGTAECARSTVSRLVVTGHIRSTGSELVLTQFGREAIRSGGVTRRPCARCGSEMEVEIFGAGSHRRFCHWCNK